MGKHTVVVDAGNMFVTLLREHLVPDTIINPDSIGLCSPDERGDMLLGVHLYDIRECEEVQSTAMINIDSRTQRYPSTYLTLSFMVTAYSSADTKFKAVEEQKIIGRVIQVIADNGILKMPGQQGERMGDGLDIRITMLKLDTEEKHKLWQFPNMAYKTSLFYKVSPVEVESERIKRIQRVVEAEFTAEE